MCIESAEFIKKSTIYAKAQQFGITKQIHPPVTNELSHLYRLDESIFIFSGIRSNFSFLFHFSMKFMSANRITPDRTPRFAASHLRLFCFPMSHKKDSRLLWVKHV